MSKVSWSFAGYIWPQNPADDSGWIGELVENETVPIGSNSSKFQYGGRKSRRRRVSGHMIGMSAKTFKEKMDNWLLSRTKASLKDHNGDSSSARLISFSAKAVRDVRGLRYGYQAWQYDAEFVEV